MTNINAQKKKKIDDVMTDYTTRLSTLKQKSRDIVKSFLEVLKERRINEIRQSIK